MSKISFQNNIFLDQGESQYLVTIFFHLAEASGKYQKDAEKFTDKYFIKAIIYRK